MKIFIDSADLDEIKQFYEWGIADGITTNPSLMKKAVDKLKKQGEDINLRHYIKEICTIARGTPVSLEVTATSADDIIKEGKALYRMFNSHAKNVYIKIPINPAFKTTDPTQFDGIKAIRELSRLKIPTNCTLIFTPEQALLAAKAGATLISPFAGREDDFIRKKNRIKFKKEDHVPPNGYTRDGKHLSDNGILSGVDLVHKCAKILKHYDLPTQVLAASLRNAQQVRDVALAGADIATLPFSVIKEMLIHKKTQEGMVKFTKDVVDEYRELTGVTHSTKSTKPGKGKKLFSSKRLGFSVEWRSKK